MRTKTAVISVFIKILYCRNLVWEVEQIISMSCSVVSTPFHISFSLHVDLFFRLR